MLVLIGGGSRSGKSRFALDYARNCGAPQAFIATAETLDDEMRARAATHRAERGDHFATIEEPVELSRAIREASGRFRAIVVDCLTLWLSNLLLRGRDVARESAGALLAACETESTIILVTNEVGCGIVPESDLARRFRDEAGALNQRAATAANEVYWMVFGIPMRVK